MKKILISAFILLVFANYSYAQPISSAELINNAKFYNGKVVLYGGEVIGDVMIRGGYAWLNVNDGKNAIGIWTTRDSAADINYTGSYKSRGDYIEVIGVFNRACLQHGGDLDIHAQSIWKIRSGRHIIERANTNKRNLAVILLGVLCLLWILKRLKLK